MCPCVIDGNLPVVSEWVPCHSIIDWHSDKMMPIERASSILYARMEYGQTVGFSIELFFER